MADFCTCSHCGADLRVPVIEPEELDYFDGAPICLHGCGQPSHYSRLVLRETGRPGGLTAWRCPDCGHEEAHRG